MKLFALSVKWLIEGIGRASQRLQNPFMVVCWARDLPSLFIEISLLVLQAIRQTVNLIFLSPCCLFSQHFSMNNGFLIKLELANEVSWFRIQPTSRVWNFQKSCNTESRVLIKSLPLVSSLGNSFIHSRLHFLKLPLAHRQAFDVNERTFFTYQWMNEWKMQIQLCKSTFSHRESLLISFWNLDLGNFPENGRIFITKCVF